MQRLDGQMTTDSPITVLLADDGVKEGLGGPLRRESGLQQAGQGNTERFGQALQGVNGDVRRALAFDPLVVLVIEPGPLRNRVLRKPLPPSELPEPLCQKPTGCTGHDSGIVPKGAADGHLTTVRCIITYRIAHPERNRCEVQQS